MKTVFECIKKVCDSNNVKIDLNNNNNTNPIFISLLESIDEMGFTNRTVSALEEVQYQCLLNEVSHLGETENDDTNLSSKLQKEILNELALARVELSEEFSMVETDQFVNLTRSFDTEKDEDDEDDFVNIGDSKNQSKDTKTIQQTPVTSQSNVVSTDAPKSISTVGATTINAPKASSNTTSASASSNVSSSSHPSSNVPSAAVSSSGNPSSSVPSAAVSSSGNPSSSVPSAAVSSSGNPSSSVPSATVSSTGPSAKASTVTPPSATLASTAQSANSSSANSSSANSSSANSSSANSSSANASSPTVPFATAPSLPAPSFTTQSSHFTSSSFPYSYVPAEVTASIASYLGVDTSANDPLARRNSSSSTANVACLLNTKPSFINEFDIKKPVYSPTGSISTIQHEEISVNYLISQVFKIILPRELKIKLNMVEVQNAQEANLVNLKLFIDKNQIGEKDFHSLNEKTKKELQALVNSIKPEGARADIVFPLLLSKKWPISVIMVALGHDKVANESSGKSIAPVQAPASAKPLNKG